MTDGAGRYRSRFCNASSNFNMALCCKCGAGMAPDENFCGNCGARQQPDNSPVVSGGIDLEATADNVEIPVESQGLLIAEPSDKLVVEATAPSSANQSSGTGEMAESEKFSSLTSRGGEPARKRSKPKSLAAGKVLNSRYEIVRRIGGGGMGAVYLAKDRNLGDAPRAVKEMIESHLDDTQHEKAIADFKRESLLLTSLEHPSIPTVYDYFYDDNSERFYLVMKFIPGSDLSSRLRKTPGGRIEEPTVTEWAIQTADVLEYLHTRRQAIIYRDLKPANLMLDSNNNRIMLIDFGIARWVNKQEKGVTAVGTMGYAPPELFSGRADPRVDIYSLGATMFHLLTGTTELDASFLLQKDSNLLGRTDPLSNIFPEVDLSRFDPQTKVSRRHARIWREGETFLVEDLGSVNGTVVNDVIRLEPRQPRPLDSGDRIRLGETTVHFLLG